MKFADIIRIYTGEESGEVSDDELKEIERKLKKTASCEKCGFCYQYNTHISQLKDLTSLDKYNTVLLEVFCEDRYTLTKDGFRCDFEQKADRQFKLKKCPKCGKGLVFTVVAMNVSSSGLVESFCAKCGGMVSSGRPFMRV